MIIFQSDEVGSSDGSVVKPTRPVNTPSKPATPLPTLPFRFPCNGATSHGLTPLPHLFSRNPNTMMKPYWVCGRRTRGRRSEEKIFSAPPTILFSLILFPLLSLSHLCALSSDLFSIHLLLLLRSTFTPSYPFLHRRSPTPFPTPTAVTLLSPSPTAAPNPSPANSSPNLKGFVLIHEVRFRRRLPGQSP